MSRRKVRLDRPSKYDPEKAQRRRPDPDSLLIRPVDITKLPEELKAELLATKHNGLGYTIVDLVLAFLVHHGQATADDFMIYVYQTRNKVISRGYLRQVIFRLRKQGLLEQRENRAPYGLVYKPTDKALKQAKPYIKPRGTKS